MVESVTESAAAGDLHRIVVVGGGAGGLELATRLGRRYRKPRQQLPRQVEVTLIEPTRTHFWKPHLHEIAAGSMDLARHDTDYLEQAYVNGFRWIAGPMIGLDRQRRLVRVGPMLDADGEPISGDREVPYDTLVIAIGSLTHDFGIPGAHENAIALETPAQADRFHDRLVYACFSAQEQAQPIAAGQLRIAIIGAGATGVELAAELHRSTRSLVSYGLDRIDPNQHLPITLIEAADRILPALPERLSTQAATLLRRLNVDMRTSARVAAVNPGSVVLSDGETIPAHLIVWAAGIKAPPVLATLDGLAVNRINQLLVKDTLQTTADAAIFAIGDCAACPWTGKPEGTMIPARAQAAHQQSSHVVRQIQRLLEGQPLTPFRYRDFGSLVSLGRYSAVGNLMGGLSGSNVWIEGWVARLMYRMLYLQHQMALKGVRRVSLDTLASILRSQFQPSIKLH